MAQNHTGHNARHWHSTTAQRQDAARIMPQAPSTCDKLQSYLPTHKEFGFDLLMETFTAWVELELAFLNDLEFFGRNGARFITLVNVEESGFNSAVHIYLAAIGVTRLHHKTLNYSQRDRAWYAVVVYDWFARRRYPVKFAANMPVKPQDGRSATDGDWVAVQVAKIKKQRGSESLATEARWHEARRQREARINDVCHWRYRKPITEEKVAA